MLESRFIVLVLRGWRVVNALLALVRGGQHFVEFRAAAQFLQQRISQQGRVSTVVLLHCCSNHVQRDLFLAAEGHDRTLTVPRLGIRFGKCGGFILRCKPVQLRGGPQPETGFQDLTMINRTRSYILNLRSRLSHFAFAQ